MFVTAIIAAGGRGQRFGGARPKQLLSVGGRPILERSVARVSRASVDRRGRRRAAGGAASRIRLRTCALPKPLRIVAGGARRQDSVANAFRAVGDASDVIVIHDAARPFASADLIARTIAAAAESGAALAAVQARDTVKRVKRRRRGRAADVVRTTLPREIDFSRADAAGVPPRRAARRAGARRAMASTRPTRRRWPSARATPCGSSTARRRTSRSRRRRIWRGGSDRAAARRSRRGTRRGPGAPGTGYDLHRLVDGRPLDARRRDDSVRARRARATPTPTSSATR